MHVEIKVAQNFVLNFLYNKLPRRRINLFGDELESALRDKFADHWYPDKPFKGSAFRCLKITDPADPVLNRAARESGNPVPDIVENLPTDLAIWIDPGEVSYRIGEKGSVKILYSESLDGSYMQNYVAPANPEEPQSPEAAAVAAATAAAMAAAASFHAVGFLMIEKYQKTLISTWQWYWHLTWQSPHLDLNSGGANSMLLEEDIFGKSYPVT